MSGRRVLLLAVAVAVVVTVVTASTKASFAECTHNDDCGPLSCCLLGKNFYRQTISLSVPISSEKLVDSENLFSSRY
ncbi:hypothetical protein E2C01_095993 [Portunus trituberculatus]|uniref:Prokineticin domain-containing protein n=1 Tax=Portunus trituberculatus TaxID=210409 RepID=A0A5B7K5G3_PORTR|nr:hypothetical protein [Portunus trituberculatus]